MPCYVKDHPTLGHMFICSGTGERQHQTYF